MLCHSRSLGSGPIVAQCHVMPEVNMIVAYRLESSSTGLWAHDMGVVWQSLANQNTVLIAALIMW